MNHAPTINVFMQNNFQHVQTNNFLQVQNILNNNICKARSSNNCNDEDDERSDLSEEDERSHLSEEDEHDEESLISEIKLMLEQSKFTFLLYFRF